MTKLRTAGFRESGTKGKGARAGDGSDPRDQSVSMDRNKGYSPQAKNECQTVTGAETKKQKGGGDGLEERQKKRRGENR